MKEYITVGLKMQTKTLSRSEFIVKFPLIMKKFGV